MARSVGRSLGMLPLLLIGCQNVASESKPQITQTQCEAKPRFSFVQGGAFIAGSDRTERDYAYRISAEGFADSPEDIAAAEAGYRQRKWFE
ncbi:MAG: sulfatase-modifying factor protein, partial [Symploca sp. SIO2G7]|nr:sulfatase-modifying factor protein [Symploca sp. SIO2G7]